MLTLPSPAKVNLFLRIIKKRTDGYHELASLFQAIDLCDYLYFKKADKDQLTCTDAAIPIDSSNLVSKAVQLFRRKTTIQTPFSIHLEKNIPHQAGLGGGSSNAATTLWALNQLTGKPATNEMLKSWSAEIGSDIPFFLSNGTAYCTGRGEIVESLNPLSKMCLWIVKPFQGLSTADVFNNLDTSLLIQRDPKVILKDFLNDQPIYFNDLEQPALKALPALKEIKLFLQNLGFNTVLMSGSGSSFFCIGDITMPPLPGLTSYRVQFINRLENEWFSAIVA